MAMWFSSLADVFVSGAGAGFGGLFLLVALAGLALTIIHIIALVQCVTSNFSDSTNKIVWILVILFLPLIGSIMWFAVGKTQANR